MIKDNLRNRDEQEIFISNMEKIQSCHAIFDGRVSVETVEIKTVEDSERRTEKVDFFSNFQIRNFPFLTFKFCDDFSAPAPAHTQ